MIQVSTVLQPRHYLPLVLLITTTITTIAPTTDFTISPDFDEKAFLPNEVKDEHLRRSREVVEIMAKIRPETKEKDVSTLCEKLMDLFVKYVPEELIIFLRSLLTCVDSCSIWSV